MRRWAAVAGTVLLSACRGMTSVTGPVVRFVDGTYVGTDAVGTLSWTLRASTDAVTGAGSFVGGSGSVVYRLRGRYVGNVLTVRLVGAPGDTDQDSVWFSGRAISELYAGAGVAGTLRGPTAVLFGPLSMYLVQHAELLSVFN